MDIPRAFLVETLGCGGDRRRVLLGVRQVYGRTLARGQAIGSTVAPITLDDEKVSGLRPMNTEREAEALRRHPSAGKRPKKPA